MAHGVRPYTRLSDRKMLFVAGAALLGSPGRPAADGDLSLILGDDVQVPRAAGGEADGLVDAELEDLGFVEGGGLLAHGEHRLEPTIGRFEDRVGARQLCGALCNALLEVFAVRLEFAHRQHFVGDVLARTDRARRPVVVVVFRLDAVAQIPLAAVAGLDARGDLEQPVLANRAVEVALRARAIIG